MKVVSGQWSEVGGWGRWVGVAAILLVIVAALGQTTRNVDDRASMPSGAPAPQGMAPGVRFEAVDVVVDSGKVGLGAYQIEVKAPAGVEIVGLEGGEGVFAQAPFYDPKALMGRRIVVAGFSTEEVGKLPKGAGRVARLHLQVVGGAGVPELEKKLVVATDARGKTIPASVTLRVFEGANR